MGPMEMLFFYIISQESHCGECEGWKIFIFSSIKCTTSYDIFTAFILAHLDVLMKSLCYRLKQEVKMVSPYYLSRTHRITPKIGWDARLPTNWATSCCQSRCLDTLPLERHLLQHWWKMTLVRSRVCMWVCEYSPKRSKKGVMDKHIYQRR